MRNDLGRRVIGHFNVGIVYNQAELLGCTNIPRPIVRVKTSQHTFFSLVLINASLSTYLHDSTGVLDGGILVDNLAGYTIACRNVSGEQGHLVKQQLIYATSVLLVVPRLESRGCPFFFTLGRDLPPGRYFKQMQNIRRGQDESQTEFDLYEDRRLVTKFQGIVGGEYYGTISVTNIWRVNQHRGQDLMLKPRYQSTM